MSNKVTPFLERNTASGKVMRYIKNMILYKKLKPGDRMPTETELCGLIDVSRTAVREAIKILEANGIVEVRRGDGTYISSGNTPSTYDTLLFRAILQKVSPKELGDFREAIELEVLRLAISHAQPEDIARLQASYRAMEQVIADAPNDPVALHSLDVEFHLIVSEAAHNLLLKDTYLSIMDIYSPLILRNYKIGQTGQSTLEAHRLILDSIVQRDLVKSYCAARFSTDLCASWIERSEDFLCTE